jgi:rRNA processing protein Krr1/Pno1
MDNEIQLISDGDGLAVIGDAPAVERFLVAEGLPSKGLGLPWLGAALSTGAGVAQAGSELAANSGRWVKLTAESAQRVKKFGLMETKTPGVSHAMVGQPGSIESWLQIETGSFPTNPAVLAGAAGIMAQLAMQQAVDEITDYLAAIDEKVDDVLRAQKDAVLARMIGVGFVIQEAMTVRASRGRVDEVTWSKVQTAPATIAETQAYALRQLDALAEKMERKTKIGELAEAAKQADAKVREWLAVLARCFQLQDAIAVLELDRVLDASPEELDGH